MATFKYETNRKPSPKLIVEKISAKIPKRKFKVSTEEKREGKRKFNVVTITTNGVWKGRDNKTLQRIFPKGKFVT